LARNTKRNTLRYDIKKR